MEVDSPLTPTTPGAHPFDLNFVEDYTWTTAGDNRIKHKKMIGVGGYGEVHEVLASVTIFTKLNRCLTLLPERYTNAND
jgi:hypothetical protein